MNMIGKIREANCSGKISNVVPINIKKIMRLKNRANGLEIWIVLFSLKRLKYSFNPRIKNRPKTIIEEGVPNQSAPIISETNTLPVNALSKRLFIFSLKLRLPKIMNHYGSLLFF